MAAICIGPVCIPYTAFIPFFYLIWAPLYKWLQRTFPSIFAQKPKAKLEDAASDGAVAEKARGKRAKAADADGPVQRKSSASAVVVLRDDEEWAAVAAAAAKAGVPVVANFTATWCGPCQAIAPAFVALAAAHPRAVYVKVDVDTCPDTAAACRVSAMPTFVVLAGGNEVAKVTGANRGDLQAMLEKHCSA